MKKIDSLKLMSGVPIFYEELGFGINQPKLKDIAILGEVDFYSGLAYFLITKEKLNIEFLMSDFDLFMFILNTDKAIQKQVADILVLTIENLDSINFYESFIILKFFEQECIIDEPKFLIIKETLIQIFCLENGTLSNDLNPANKKALEIAEKLRKRKQHLSESSQNQSADIFSNLISMLAIGSNTLSLEDCLNLTVYQIQNLIKRFTMYQEHNVQIQALMQGAKDIEPVEWTKQL